MITRVVAWCGRHPIRVLVAASVLAGASIFGQRALSRDVLPDLSDPQVVVVADWMGHPAMEVADQVTRVLADALAGVPGATAVRGQSMSGMAYLDVIFGSTSEVARGRADIADRIDKVRARLPATVRVDVGPEASSTGWIYQYALLPPDTRKGMTMGARRPDKAATSMFGLRRFQDEVLRPRLAAIPGVAEVASLGGDKEELLIETTPDQLAAAGVAYSDLVSATRVAMSKPGATIEQVREASLGVKHNDMHGGTSEGAADARVSRVATVNVAAAMASGMADVDGARPVVAGIVIAKRDANVEAVLRQVRDVIEQERANLPPGAQLGVVYDRSELGERVQHTLYRAVGEEIVVVALVVLLFLVHLRSALLPLLTLPLIVLLTFVAMRVLGVPATIMSLGGIAIALGMAVDADLVALEACHRRLEAPDAGGPASRRAALIAAAGSFAPAILTSLVIAALAFIPVFAFGGESGRLLRPLAITKTLVIAAAALLTLTVAPALRDRLVRGRIRPEMANPLTRALVRAYRPFVHFALSRPLFTLATAGLAALSCLPIATHLGGEFLPRIDEGTLFYMPMTAPGITPADANTDMARQDEAIADHLEVALVFGKSGRAETATDPAPFSMIETTIRLKPRDEWPRLYHKRWYSSWAGPRTKRVLGSLWPEKAPSDTAELIERLDRTTRFPGWTNAWTAPIRARLDMMSTGVRTPVGVRIVTDDPARIDALGAAVRAAVSKVPGTKSAVYEGLGGETRLAFVADEAAMARHKVDPALVRATADLFISGGRFAEMRVPKTPLDTPLLLPSQINAAHAGHAHGHDDHPAAASKSGAGTTPLPPPQADWERRTAPAADRPPVPVRISLAARWHPKPPEQLLRDMTVRGGAGEGQPVPLALLGRPKFVSAPAQLRTERGASVGYVYVNLEEGTDIATYVERARDLVAGALASGAPRLAANERIEWTGQYELMIAGEKRLKIIAPIVVLLMLGLLLWQFRSLTEALIVLVAVPFALVGSFWTLYFLGYKLSAPVWVGLLSVVGLAMQTGVVMVVYIDDAFHRRLRGGLIRSRADIVAAHAEGTVLRLRPKIMTISTMAAALLPLLWAQGAGSEVMKRVAAPMLGGLITSAFLTLEVIPVLYTIWRHQQLKRALRAGRSLEDVLTPAPTWAGREAA